MKKQEMGVPVEKLYEVRDVYEDMEYDSHTPNPVFGQIYKNICKDNARKRAVLEKIFGKPRSIYHT